MGKGLAPFFFVFPLFFEASVVSHHRDHLHRDHLHDHLPPFLPSQDEILTLLYFLRQIFGAALGLVCGILPLLGFIGILR